MKEQMVASILKVSTDKITLLWIGTLPVKVKMGTANKVLRKSQGATHILWREGLGFRVFYPIDQEYNSSHYTKTKNRQLRR
jgi:hypothetical protein